MPQRQAFEVDGLAHTNPIPAASRVGPILWSSPVVPRDATTGETPAEIAEQVEIIFTNIGLILAEAGYDFEHIGRIEFTLLDKSDRAALNEVWTRYFPDRTSRPARRTTESASLPPGARLTATFEAYAGD